MDKWIYRIQNDKNMEDVEQLVKQVYPQIYAYVIRRVYDSSLAKDITQETFYSFFRNLQNYTHHGKLLNYLYRIANSKVMDYHRQNARMEDDYDIDSIVDKQIQPHEKAMENSVQNEIQRYIMELSSKDQEVIILRYYHDMKFKDIADITGLHISTVKSRLKAALHTLETRWKEGEHDA